MTERLTRRNFFIRTAAETSICLAFAGSTFSVEKYGNYNTSLVRQQFALDNPSMVLYDRGKVDDLLKPIASQAQVLIQQGAPQQNIQDLLQRSHYQQVIDFKMAWDRAQKEVDNSPGGHANFVKLNIASAILLPSLICFPYTLIELVGRIARRN